MTKPQEDIVHVYFDGIITIDDLLNYHNDLAKIMPSISNLKMLAHFNNISTQFIPSEMRRISENARKVVDYSKNVKLALLSDETLATAYLLLYIRYLEEIAWHYKVFCTEESAIEWLNE